MTKNKFSGLNTEELIKKRNFLKGILIGVGIVGFCLIFGMALYFYFNKSSAKLFIPLAVLPVTLLPAYLQLKAMDTEIKSRS